MSRLTVDLLIGVFVAALFVGCAKVNDLQYLVGEPRTNSEDGTEELDYYLDHATKIDYPDVYQASPEQVTLSGAPRTIMDLNKDKIRDMALEECIRTALLNTTVIRTKSSFLSPGNAILANPNNATSIYDPSIQASGVLFGGRGVEAALSAFDTSLSTQMTWGRNEAVQNNPAGNNLPGGTTFVGETGNFSSSLSKNFAYGASFQVGHNVNYLSSNSPSLFSSAYSGNLNATYQHPLLAGSGTEFTRIAGPISSSFGGLTGVTQGVLIARINQDISLTDLEGNLTNLVKDVEDSYWELYLQYRIYDTIVAARNSALRTWRDSKRKLEIGGVRGFSVEDEAQARDQYFNTKALAQQSLSLLYKNEAALRRLIGLAVNDGEIIRPLDEPITARLDPDWASSIADALTNRVELRNQKWNVKSLELQLLAATNLVRPRLDFVANYSINGFGDTLIGNNNQPYNSFYDSLSNQKQTSWSTGFVMQMPIGLRSARSQVQNIELRLTKARDVLATQELEIAHEVGNAFQELAEKYMTAQTYFNRREAAKDRAELFEKKFRVGTQTLDLLLRAQSSLAEAEVEYFRSLVAYSQAIANLHYRQGTLLPFNNVYMAEGEWEPEAYYDAYRRAKSRTYAFDASNRKSTKPPEFVETSFGTASDGEYFNAEPIPTSRPMTTESAFSPPADDATDTNSATDPEGSAEFISDGLNSLRTIPEPSPLNLLAPPTAPEKSGATNPGTAKSINGDRTSATRNSGRKPISQTMSPAAKSTLRPSPTAPVTSSTASTIEPSDRSEFAKAVPDTDGFLPPVRVSKSAVTRVRAR
ncbi:MAG: TolC family protein [Rhodopirellula sp.]|nr:TolC family protein [Rhodopirellula sp.]